MGKLEGITFIASFFLFTWMALFIPETTLLIPVITGFILALLLTVLVAHLNRHNRRRAMENYERQWYCSK